MTTLEQAQKVKSTGSPLSIEQIVKIIEKKAAKSKKNSNKNWARREEMAKATEELNEKLSKMNKFEQINFFEQVEKRNIEGQAGGRKSARFAGC